MRIDPIAIGNVVLNNQARAKLWRQLLEEQGYTSDTFPVNVAIDPSYFGTPPAGMQPLTGVQIDFRGADSITLTPAAPVATATLRQGYLAMLLGEPRSYKYRVINQHADGSGGTHRLAERRGGYVDRHAGLTSFGESTMLIFPRNQESQLAPMAGFRDHVDPLLIAYLPDGLTIVRDVAGAPDFSCCAIAMRPATQPAVS